MNDNSVYGHCIWACNKLNCYDCWQWRTLFCVCVCWSFQMIFLEAIDGYFLISWNKNLLFFPERTQVIIWRSERMRGRERETADVRNMNQTFKCFRVILWLAIKNGPQMRVNVIRKHWISGKFCMLLWLNATFGFFFLKSFLVHRSSFLVMKVFYI